MDRSQHRPLTLPGHRAFHRRPCPHWKHLCSCQDPCGLWESSPVSFNPWDVSSLLSVKKSSPTTGGLALGDCTRGLEGTPRPELSRQSSYLLSQLDRLRPGGGCV